MEQPNTRRFKVKRFFWRILWRAGFVGDQTYISKRRIPRAEVERVSREAIERGWVKPKGDDHAT